MKLPEFASLNLRMKLSQRKFSEGCNKQGDKL